MRKKKKGTATVAAANEIGMDTAVAAVLSLK